MLSAYELDERANQRLEELTQRQNSASKTPAKNRGRLDTVAEIVNACSGGANKSRVMLVANVNSLVATELLNKLETSGLVSCTKEGNSVVYHTTEDGMKFVNKYSDLVSMLCPGMVPQTRVCDLSRQVEAWV